MDKFVKSERKRFESQIQALTDEVRGVVVEGRQVPSVSSKSCSPFFGRILSIPKILEYTFLCAFEGNDFAMLRRTDWQPITMVTMPLRRMTASKDADERERLHEKELARVQQIHRSEIESIQREYKELEQLHRGEVMQVTRRACLTGFDGPSRALARLRWRENARLRWRRIASHSPCDVVLARNLIDG